MKAYVGVTDPGWFQYLADRPGIREANFWRPHGARAFRVLTPGEPFIFKTRAPGNRIVGGGLFQAFETLPISRAWEFFGEGNGVGSEEELIARLCRITGETAEEVGDREIGCVLLRDVICLPDVEFLPTPVSFATNIVQGRSYEFPGEDPIVDSVARRIVAQEDLAYFTLEPLDLGPTRGDARMVIPRLGQSGFKAVVQEVYQRRCAVTGHKIVPTLQAAHILPVAKGGQHRIDNGLLLRSDVHTMFDRGYIGIDTEFRLQVSPRLRDDFGNGDEFYSKEGAEITLPLKAIERPSQTFLTWHLQNTFR